MWRPGASPKFPPGAGARCHALSLQSSASPIMIVVELPSTSRLLRGAQEPFPLPPVSHNSPADPLHAQLPTAVGTTICFAQPWPRLQTSPVSKREALYLQFSFSKEKSFGGTQVPKIPACWELFADHMEHGMQVVRGLDLQKAPYRVLPWDYWVL